MQDFKQKEEVCSTSKVWNITLLFDLISRKILFKIQYIGQSKLSNVLVILPITLQYFISDFSLLLYGERYQKEHYFLESKGPYKVKMLCKIIFYHQANSLQFSEHLWKSGKSMVSLCILSNVFIQFTPVKNALFLVMVR